LNVTVAAWRWSGTGFAIDIRTLIVLSQCTHVLNEEKKTIEYYSKKKKLIHYSIASEKTRSFFEKKN